MPANLKAPQLEQIQHMIKSGSPRAEIAFAAGCKAFGNVRAPRKGVGRRRSITPVMLEAILERLKEKPTLYLDELVVIIYDDFGKHVTKQSLSRTLTSIGWSNKAARQRAKERNADLRDYYVHRLSAYASYELVYVDESGCDKRVGFRRTGWSPLGVTPVQISKFHRDKRYQILPAYIQEGVLISRVFQGSTDAGAFEDFMKDLLNALRDPQKVIIMDNASFHRTERIKEMCRDAGVELIYLPPYSPDLNPIKDFFAELKQFIKTR